MMESNYTVNPEDHSLYALYGVEDLFKKEIDYLAVWATFPCFPCYAIGFYYRQQIVKKLEQFSLSESTRKMQRNLLKASWQTLFTALTFSAAIQFAMITVCSSYTIQQLKFPFREYIPYFEELFICLALLSVFNPMITIHFVQSYRAAVIRSMKFLIKQKKPVQPIHSNSTMATRSSEQVTIKIYN